MRLEVITPKRECEPGASTSQFATRQPVVSLLPFSRSLLKSRPCLIRAERPKRSWLEAEVAIPLAGVIRLESSACDRPDGDCAKWLCRSCWNCDSRTRVAVCGGFSTV